MICFGEPPLRWERRDRKKGQGGKEGREGVEREEWRGEVRGRGKVGRAGPVTIGLNTLH